MFYGHLTLSRDFGLLSPYPAFYFIVYLGVWNAWGTFFLLEVLTTCNITKDSPGVHSTLVTLTAD